MTRNIILIILNSLIIIIGCDVQFGSEPVTEKDIIGEYIANYNAGLLEKIIIKPDGYYYHYYKSNDSIEYIDSSKWELYNELDDASSPRILLCDFINRYPIESHCYYPDTNIALDITPRDWNPYVFKRGNKIRIERCYSRYQNYIKKNR